MAIDCVLKTRKKLLFYGCLAMFFYGMTYSFSIFVLPLCEANNLDKDQVILTFNITISFIVAESFLSHYFTLCLGAKNYANRCSVLSSSLYRSSYLFTLKYYGSLHFLRCFLWYWFWHLSFRKFI